MWWVIWPAGAAVIWIIKKILDSRRKSREAIENSYRESRKAKKERRQAKRQRARRVTLEERGSFDGDKILLIGRTGSGKSSLINMVKGERVVDVGHINSTTKWLEGVPAFLETSRVVFVDTPGIGEAFTSEDYHAGILDWYERNVETVTTILLVIQADAKAHADDRRLLDALRVVPVRKRVIIALNQVDKVMPVRRRFVSEDWETESRRADANSEKIANIEEKIVLLRDDQFKKVCDAVIPVVCEPGYYFNHRALISALSDSVDLQKAEETAQPPPPVAKSHKPNDAHQDKGTRSGGALRCPDCDRWRPVEGETCPFCGK